MTDGTSSMMSEQPVKDASEQRDDVPEGLDIDEPVKSHRDLIVPDSDGLMPFFDAVYWIATKGHTKREDGSGWDDAARDLL